MRITTDVKKYFFDRDLVLRKADRGAIRALSRFGAFVRRRARSSIRKRKRVSNPGEPPSAHATTDPNLRTIFFFYDPDQRSVVVGPIQFNGRGRAHPVGMTVPELLEKGGILQLPKTKRNPGRRVSVAARPFMGPAFEAERPKAPSYFHNVIKP